MQGLIETDRHLRPRLDKVGKAFGENPAFALVMLTKELANSEMEVNSLPATRHIPQGPVIPAM